MKTYYYNLDDGAFIYPSGDRCNVIPELFYQDQTVWRIALRDRRDRPVDISGITAWGAAVDNNYCSGSAPMCRTLSERITADVESGAVEVAIDAATPEFLAAVNGVSVKPAFFELYGLNVSGERVLSLCFEIRTRMTLDPDPSIGGEIPEAIATKNYAAAVAAGSAGAVSATLRGEIDARPTSSGARQIASSVVQSGGYVDYTGARKAASDYVSSGAYITSSGAKIAASGAAVDVVEKLTSSGAVVGVSGARQIASAVATSGGFIDTPAARQIAEETVAAASAPVVSEIEVYDWSSTSGYIPVLRGGVCYHFLTPVSALTIGAVESCAGNATILCHFSGGTNFLYPPAVQPIGEDAVESGFCRIGVNRGQMIVAPVSNVGPAGVSIGGSTSAWVISDLGVGGGETLTVYNGGAARNISVASGENDAGKMTVSGGYASCIIASSGGVVSAVAGVMCELTLAAKGTAFVRGGTVSGLHLVHSGSTPRLYLSGGGIVKGGDTIGTNEFWVYDGGIAENVSFGSGTFANLWSGAVVNGGTFNGSRLSITSGAVVSGITILTPYVGQTQSNGCFSGGVMSDCIIGSGGVYTVRGGSAYGTVVSGAGARFVVSGGTANGVIVSSGASLTVSSGGTALAVEVRAGGVVSSATGAEVEYV